MSKVSRRTFLSGGSLTVAAGTLAVAVPSLIGAAPANAAESERELSTKELGAAEANGTLVARITDLRTGEISLYQGESKVVYRDRGLAARLSRAIAREGK